MNSLLVYNDLKKESHYFHYNFITSAITPRDPSTFNLMTTIGLPQTDCSSSPPPPSFQDRAPIVNAYHQAGYTPGF
jgi:hypothetical protein